MHIIYFDEVKYQPDVQPYYWLGGIMVPDSSVPLLESELQRLSIECFGHPYLRKETEFHAKDIFHRKANFKDWKDIQKRLEVLQKVVTIAISHEDVLRLYVRIDPALMLASDYEEKAFMFFVEKANALLRKRQSTGILIGDHERSIAKPSIYELSRYRAHGTDYLFGKNIDRLIDTVHFAHSHHSRLLQLADAYMFALQFRHDDSDDNYPRKKFSEFLKSQALWGHAYKEWPTESSWYAARAH